MNLPHQLATELVRVTELRCRYEGLRGMRQANPEPAITLMNLAISAGIEAFGSGDAAAMMDAVQQLKGFTD